MAIPCCRLSDRPAQRTVPAVVVIGNSNGVTAVGALLDPHAAAIQLHHRNVVFAGQPPRLLSRGLVARRCQHQGREAFALVARAVAVVDQRIEVVAGLLQQHPQQRYGAGGIEQPFVQIDRGRVAGIAPQRRPQLTRRTHLHRWQDGDQLAESLLRGGSAEAGLADHGEIRPGRQAVEQ